MAKFKRKTFIGVTGLVAAATAMTVSVPAMADEFLGENFDCSTAVEDFARTLRNNEAPQSATLIQQMQHLIWMLESAIAKFDASCRNDPTYPVMRAYHMDSLTSARSVCQQVMTSPDVCHARRYQ